ncbi:MAG: YhcN/YlaJ family sporulation lipoprotein [Clostridia bacterium]|nr:YhcN/YlaJ family sporulation lipoprotein [Clostridia bacterium]
MKRTTLVILCVALVCALAGCASNVGTPLPSPEPYGPTMLPSSTMMPAPVMPEGTAAPGATVGPETTGAMSTVDAAAAAKRVSDEVVKLSEIDKATTVVMGNTALIGVHFATQYRGEMTTRIKDMVEERAKAAAPSIQRISITADPDLIARIQAILTKVQNGASATEIGAEFSEIVNRVVPV